LQHPFPYFGLQYPSGYPDAFTQIAEQVTADHPNIGVHVWDLGRVLDRSLTIDRLHPTVQGHVVLGAALAERLRPLIADT
jgi:lysophospholipase L1-like esterase